MDKFKLLILSVLVSLLLFSCKKSENVKYDSVLTYDYKVILSSDNKIKEIDMSSNNNFRYKAVFQYINKILVQNNYDNVDNLLESKTYYLNDSGLVDSSRYLYYSYNKIYNDTTIGKYQYINGRLSEVIYSINYFSVFYSDTVHSNTKNSFEFEYNNNILSSNLNGQIYTFTSIKNKLGFSILDFEYSHINFNFGFVNSIFGVQEDFLLSTIQYNKSSVNIARFSYTINNDGLITKIIKTYPNFNYTDYSVENDEIIYTFSYTNE